LPKRGCLSLGKSGRAIFGSGARNKKFMHNREIQLKKDVCFWYEIPEFV
jgi:hypothetical protein